MTRILGIDPGSRVTGYGVIECSSKRIRYVSSGSIRLPEGDLSQRLYQIFKGIEGVIQQHRPQVAVVEQVFVSVNPQSALKIGHARGGAICACAASNVAIEEYSAREIKKSITGTGAARKDQVKYMVLMLLGLDHIRSQDEVDALAAAITHFQHIPMKESIQDTPQRAILPEAVATTDS